jgi:flavin-dependent dehydrogenase
LRELDVAIVGGGLAGSLLARQLRLARPELRVGLFEQSTATSYKVGEATVEIAANYLTRKQGLTNYLYEHHLPKNGLRYFFDSPDRASPLEQMSELGTVSLPFHPAFQLDRARLEADLLEMNRREGVDVRTGTRVTDIALGSNGETHHLRVEDASGRSPVAARWLVDAAGRAGILARQRGLRTEQKDHQIGSVWGSARCGGASKASRTSTPWAPRRFARASVIPRDACPRSTSGIAATGSGSFRCGGGSPASASPVAT